jgi:hypothetical protein
MRSYGLDSCGSGSGPVAGSCGAFKFHKLLGSYWLAEQLVAFQEGLSSMELVS